jgi:hypothetical protein
MTTERKRDDKPVVYSAGALRTLPSSTITSHESAEVALHNPYHENAADLDGSVQFSFDFWN